MRPTDVEFYSAPFHATIRVGSTMKDGDPEVGDTIVTRARNNESRAGIVVTASETRVQMHSLFYDKIVSDTHSNKAQVSL